MLGLGGLMTGEAVGARYSVAAKEKARRWLLVAMVEVVLLAWPSRGVEARADQRSCSVVEAAVLRLRREAGR